MKTEYEYLRFVEKSKPVNRKKGTYSCRNRKSNAEIGKVRWYGPWRQYCYFPTIQAAYSDGCLQDIADFIQCIKWEGKSPPIRPES